jgi:hypothetical protein
MQQARPFASPNISRTSKQTSGPHTINRDQAFTGFVFTHIFFELHAFELNSESSRFTNIILNK